MIPLLVFLVTVGLACLVWDTAWDMLATWALKGIDTDMEGCYW